MCVLTSVVRWASRLQSRGLTTPHHIPVIRGRCRGSRHCFGPLKSRSNASSPCSQSDTVHRHRISDGNSCRKPIQGRLSFVRIWRRRGALLPHVSNLRTDLSWRIHVAANPRGPSACECIVVYPLPVDIRSLPHLRPRRRSVAGLHRTVCTRGTCVLFRTDAPAAIAQSWLAHVSGPLPSAIGW